MIIAWTKVSLVAEEATTRVSYRVSPCTKWGMAQGYNRATTRTTAIGALAHIDVSNEKGRRITIHQR